MNSETNQASLYEPTWRRKIVGVKANTAAPAMLPAREASKWRAIPYSASAPKMTPGRKDRSTSLSSPSGANVHNCMSSPLIGYDRTHTDRLGIGETECAWTKLATSRRGSAH